MCGIAGIFSTDLELARRAVEAMNRAQAHRGPDDEGVEALPVPGGALALGHRRLSILDLSPAGHQPMTNPGTGDWIVYNGEIYNFPELRHELEALGHRFRTRCDTEMLLHAWAEWGEGCLDRLHGMFAFGLYDVRRRRLVLARDPVGIKPLYVACLPDAVVFASEVRAIRASGLAEPRIDRAALAGLLAYGAVQAPLTMLEGVRSLEPGSVLDIDLAQSPRAAEGAASCRYWDFPRPSESGTRDEAVERLSKTLEGAVGSHLLSDVPVGVFLSSGIDSTAMAALAAASRSEPVHTFTVSLEGQEALDEAPIAAETARRIGSRHQTILLTDAQVRRACDDWLDSLDQPSVDGLNTFIISRAVREHGIIVALSGLGGDELFGGYGTGDRAARLARWVRAASWLPASARAAVFAALFYPRSRLQARKAADIARTPPRIDAMCLRLRRLLSDSEMRALGFEPGREGLSDDFLSSACPARDLSVDSDPWASASMVESRYYMGNMLLRDSDVCAMSHGVEIRVPLLDRQVLDLAYSLSGEWRRRDENGGNKPLLRDAVARHLRPEITGAGKRGFSLSQPQWMVGTLRPRFEHLIDTVAGAGLMEEKVVRRTWADFVAGRHGPYWSRPWLLGVLGAWLERSGLAGN